MNLVCQHECNEKAQKRNSVNAFKATMEQPSRTIVHAKLEMTNPDSQEEVEADAAANDIVQGGKIARSIFSGGAGGGMAVSSQMEGRLNSLQGCGQVMPDGLRNMMERGFNRDFSQVRLHTDSEAASLSSSIHAKAFTHGNDIYFNQGQFSPNTSEGQKLIAHELTHVVQGGEKVGRDPLDADEQLREKILDIFKEYIKDVVEERKAILNITINKYNNCYDNGENNAGLGAIGGAATGAAIGTAGGPLVAAGAALVGAGVGAFIGYVSSIDDEEIEDCVVAEKELSQIDEKANIIEAFFARKIYTAHDNGLFKYLYNYLKSNPDLHKRIIRGALSVQSDKIQERLEFIYSSWFDKMNESK